MNLISKAVILFIVLALCGTFAKSQSDSEKNNLKNYSDRSVVNLLSSKKASESGGAASEIFSRGGRLIPYLIGLKNDKRCFYGNSALGRWGSGVMRGDPPCKGSDRVTVEIAALFLISAIYMEDLNFAEPPYLCEKDCLEGGNSNQRVKKAWKATEEWYFFFEKQGIIQLRKNG